MWQPDGPADRTQPFGVRLPLEVMSAEARCDGELREENSETRGRQPGRNPSIHRLALLIGSVAAAAILAIGFAATGFGPSAAPANAEQPTAGAAAIAAAAAAAAVPATDPPAAKPVTRVKTTTVYVKPAPKPKVIHVTRRAPAPVVKRQAPVKQHVKVVHVTKNTGGGSGDEGDDNGGEHDGGGGEGGDD